MSISPTEVDVITAGDSYELQCNISLASYLINTTLLEAVWLDPDGVVITTNEALIASNLTSTNNPNFTTTLTFPRLTTSQGGLYSCAVNLTTLGLFKDHQVIRTSAIRVAVACKLCKLCTGYETIHYIVVSACDPNWVSNSAKVHNHRAYGKTQNAGILAALKAPTLTLNLTACTPTPLF